MRAHRRTKIPEAPSIAVMDTLWQDLRYAVRTLERAADSPSVAVLSFALGIGANTTIFTFINGLLLRPPTVPSRTDWSRSGSTTLRAATASAAICSCRFQTTSSTATIIMSSARWGPLLARLQRSSGIEAAKARHCEDRWSRLTSSRFLAFGLRSDAGSCQKTIAPRRRRRSSSSPTRYGSSGLVGSRDRRQDVSR